MTSVKKVKVALLALVAALVIAIPTSAFATTITINEAASGHVYTATQIFKGDITNVDGEDQLMNIQWADGFNSAGLIAAMNADDRFKIPEGANATAANVADVIGQIESNLYDPEVPSARTDIDALAELIKANLGSAPATTIEKGDNGYQATLADGWYFVEDTTTFDEEHPMPTDFVRTRYILGMSNDATINAKSDIPTVDKKLQEDDGQEAGEWREVADYEIGQTIPYMLEGTLPNNYLDYKKYYYKFTDTMSKGLTYGGDARVVYVNTNAQGEEVETNAGNEFVINSSVDANTGKTTLTVTAANLRSVDGITSSTVIRVYYSCVLNDNAEIGLPGNDNDVFLTFSTNPNEEGEGTPETSDTPKEYCIVFTFQMDNKKVDSATGAELAGAGFKLYKIDANNNKLYYTGTKDADGKMVWATDEGEALEFMIGTKATTFNIKGLDSRDVYYLTESTVPSGYNPMKDFKFKIDADTGYAIADYENNPGSALSKVNLDVYGEEDKITTSEGTVADGKVNATHENVSGSPLPSTGGIGTTIFTIVGIALIVAAAAIMVVRRRNAAAIQ